VRPSSSSRSPSPRAPAVRRRPRRAFVKLADQPAAWRTRDLRRRAVVVGVRVAPDDQGDLAFWSTRDAPDDAANGYALAETRSNRVARRYRRQGARLPPRSGASAEKGGRYTYVVRIFVVQGRVFVVEAGRSEDRWSATTASVAYTLASVRCAATRASLRCSPPGRAIAGERVTSARASSVSSCAPRREPRAPENTLPAFRLALELGRRRHRDRRAPHARRRVVPLDDGDGARSAGVGAPDPRRVLDGAAAWDVGRGLRVPLLEEASRSFHTLCSRRRQGTATNDPRAPIIAERAEGRHREAGRMAHALAARFACGRSAGSCRSQSLGVRR